MVNIVLRIDDPALKYTVQTLLAARGYAVASEGALTLTDNDAIAVTAAKRMPALLLATAAAIPAAVAAMRRGVYGYVFLPMQPGELEIMIGRALGAAAPEDQETAPANVGVEDIERDHILAVLRACKNNQSEAARRLGIGRNTLWRKLRAYQATDGVRR
mgnify:CR=1 FL=1